MNTHAVHRRGLVASGLWVATAGANTWSSLQDGDDWELAYTVFTLVLTAAVGWTVWVFSTITEGSERPRLRAAGLAVGALAAVAAAMAAWAFPFWMSILGASFALLAGSTAASRRAAATVATAYLAAPAIQVVAIEAFGASDGTAANLVFFATTAVAIAVLAATARSQEVAPVRHAL